MVVPGVVFWNDAGSNNVTDFTAVPAYVSMVVVLVGDVADGISTLCLTSSLVTWISPPSDVVCKETPITLSSGSSTLLFVIV